MMRRKPHSLQYKKGKVTTILTNTVTAYENPLVDLDKLYWDIYQKFSLIEGNDKTSFWASSPILCSHPGYMFNYFYGELIASQVIRVFASKQKNVLNNVKFSQFLINEFYSKGNSECWLDRIRHATGEELNVKYLI